MSMVTQDADDVEITEARPRKKICCSTKRRRATSLVHPPSAPQLFAPFRALGLITNHIPFYLQTRSYKDATDGPRIHILTCLGRSWALWEGGKMGLLFVGPEVPDPISCLVMDGDAVWAASGIHVIKYLRGKEVSRVSNPLRTPLAFIVLFGSQLLALTEDGGRMLIWDVSIDERPLFANLQFDIGFTATLILHPATYLNKVLVASNEGDMQLWNIRTQTRIHKFSHSQLCTLPSQPNMGSSSSSITAITQSPAIDVVGVGFLSGEISVYDVRADERLMRMYMDNGGIKALSFRSDGHPILASASSSGHIALWDLDSGGRLLHLIRGAHDGAVSALEWVPGQPVLISSGEDNSVKQWLYESPSTVPRLLKFRSGHHAPPHLIRFYGEDGKQLLSASADRTLRYISVVRDSRSYEMSQGSLARKATTLSKPLASLKFPPITSISSSSTRSKDWDDVLTAHADEMCVRSWTVLNKRVGKHTFNSAESFKRKAPSGVVKCVCVTACGNFGLAGSSAGKIHMWNMQSGLKRKSFKVGPCPQAVIDRLESSSMTKPKDSEHAITGLASDALNRVVIATTSDGTVNFFDFHACTLDQTMVLPSPAISIMLQRDSGLLAVVCDDMIIRIIDIETRRIVRELSCGVHGRILDIAFSSDSRWIVATSLDSVIRTFDIPTGQLINAFRTPSVATSIAFSPANDFLATAHVDSVGIFLWANRSQYSEVAFRAISEDDIAEVALPLMQGSEEDEALEALEGLGMEDTPADVFSTPSQLDGDLVTLTLLPRARWQTLLNLEVIQHRNKPKEPPKKPEHAPFFLPTLPGVEHRFAIEEKKQGKQDKETRRLDRHATKSQSILQRLLTELERNGGSGDALFDYIKSLSPAAIDVELRSLVSISSLLQFIRAIKRRLQSHLDFEAVQTLQNVVLRMHAEVIIENEELRVELEELLKVQKKEGGRVLDLLASSLATQSMGWAVEVLLRKANAARVKLRREKLKTRLVCLSSETATFGRCTITNTSLVYMLGFRPPNTSSPAKALGATQHPLTAQTTTSDVSRGSAASKSELQNLTSAEVEFFDSVVKRIPPSATSFLSGLKAYNDELHDRGWDNQTETVHYGRLLELCKLRGPSWAQKWEGVKRRHGYRGIPSTNPIPKVSAKSLIPMTKPARSITHLTTPIRDEDDDVFTLHSHQEQERDETPTELPSSDVESELLLPRPLTRLNQATRPNASVQLTRVTRTPVIRSSNNILPPALTRVSTPRPQTTAGRRPTAWEEMSDTTDGGDAPGSLSTTPPSYRAAVENSNVTISIPHNTRGQQILRAPSPIKYPVAITPAEFPKGRERKGSVINEDEAWKKIKMSRDEEDADKFREDKLLERCWEFWVLGYQWLVTTNEQVAQARDNVILGFALRSWRNATALRLEMHARAASIADARYLRFAMSVWKAKHKQKKQLQWRSDMRAKMKTVRERHDTKLIRVAWAKWQQSHRSYLSEVQYNERIVARYFLRWKNALLKLDRMDSAADDFSQRIKGGTAHRAWKHWQKVMTARDAEKTVAHKMSLRIKGNVMNLWKKQTLEYQTADAYHDVVILKRVLRSWKTARDRIRVMERRADKYLARQDAFLLRAVARVWKARERGKLLERVRDIRLVKNTMAVWKDRLRERKHQADYALAFSMRSESYTASSALRTWHQVYTVYQNRHAFAIQRHLARVQYDALLKWRIQLREKLKLMKQARIVEKFFLERKFLKVWKAKLEEHQRLKKLKELEICRVRVFMQAWHWKYQKQRSLRLGEQEIFEQVSLRIKRDALRLWTNRVIEIKLRELEISQKKAHALTVFAFKKWKNICLRHVEDLSLMESHLDIKRAENVRRMFHRWLTAARARRHKRNILRDKELELDRASVQVAWDRWRERYMDEKLRPLVCQIAIQNQKNCLFRAFGIWHSKTRSLPAIRFQASRIKMKHWAIWRAAMPQALQAKKARETHSLAVLNRAFEKWHQAYKTKTHLKEIARARYLRLPSVSPGRGNPTPKPPVRTSRSPFARQSTRVESETEESDAGPSRPAATRSSVLVNRPGIASLLANRSRADPAGRPSGKASSRGSRIPSPTRSNRTSVTASEVLQSPIRPRFTMRRPISPARSRSSYARDVSPTRSNYTSAPREEPERSRLWQELRQVQKKPKPPTEKSRTPEPP